MTILRSADPRFEHRWSNRTSKQLNINNSDSCDFSDENATIFI